MTRDVHGGAPDRGSATVELMLVGLVMIGFMMTLVGMARISLAAQSVDLASSNAARAASLARTQAVAEADARTVVDRTLAEGGFSCVSSTVEVDADQLGVSIGQRATVAVTVVCDVDLSDVTGITVLPGVFTVRATEVSPVDAYRGE